MRDRAPYVVPLAALLALHLFVVESWGQQAPGRNLQIVVAEGEGATNNVRSKANKQVVVRVEDDNHRPVVGAAVSFFLPNEGPGGTFMNGTTSLTTTTDGRGRAFAGGINFNQQAGPMEMRISASYAGQTASATVAETNVVGPVVTSSSGGGGGGGGMSTGTKILIIAVIAAGAAAGAILATRGKGSPAPAATPTVTITPGTPSVGAP